MDLRGELATVQGWWVADQASPRPAAAMPAR
jgi:hypothetical protein